MGSIAQRFYPVKTKVTGLPTGVYDQDDVSPTTDSTTTVTFTANSQSTFLIKPFTAGVAQSPGASATNFGWRYKATEDIASASGARRLIPSGTWTFQLSFTTGAYALLAANPNYSITIVVYRISSTGVATELLRKTSSALAKAASTVSLIQTSATGQPDIILEAGETIQTEWYLTGQATANTVGTVTNNPCTINVGSTTYIDFPTPGLRTLYTNSQTSGSLGKPVLRSRLVSKSLLVPTRGTARLGGRTIMKATAKMTAVGRITSSKWLFLARLLRVAQASGFNLSLVVKKFPTVRVIGTATPKKMIAKATVRKVSGTASLVRRATQYRAFLVVSRSPTNFIKAVIFVRYFLSVARPKIFPRFNLPWKVVPNGTGGTTTVVKRIINLFDD